MSLAIIVEGKVNPDFNHKRIKFGSNSMVYTGTTNYMKRRSISAIALNKSNEHGGHYFMILYTLKRLHIYQCTYLPIDDDVIAQVRDLDKEDNTKNDR